MMKKYSIILIVLLLIAFVSCFYHTKATVHVLRVYSPSLVAIDLNKNGKVEVNEKFNVEDVVTFTSEVSDYQKTLAESVGIDEETALAIGYYAEKYAQSLIENKNVKYKKLDNNNIQITVNGKNYNNLMKNSPFALENSKPVNEKLFEKQVNLAKSSKLRIFNNKSNKYHRLNCKYGQLAHDIAILPLSQIPKSAQECKFCKDVVEKDQKTIVKSDINSAEKNIIKNIKPQKFLVASGDIKLFLTDLTTVFKPSSACTTEFCTELVRQINSSNKTIDMALYGYTDIPDVTNALNNAIRRGVSIRMVYDVNAEGGNFYSDTFNLARLIVGSKGDYGDKNYQSSIMHNKFLIFDSKAVLTGSANISNTDLSGFNSNAVLLIKSPEIAYIYEQEFNQMLEGKFHTKKSIIENKENIILGDTVLSVYFSPQDSTITSTLIPLIHKAEKYIYIPAFVITHKDFVKALVEAKARNVDVKIILDATSASNKHTKIDELRKSGIAVKTENYAGKMHSKSMIIDDKYLVIGSMNFSKSGEMKNDENTLVIENSAMAKYHTAAFMYVWAKIPDTWLVKNVASESHDSLGSCFDGVDNDFDGKIDSDDSGCKSYSKPLK